MRAALTKPGHASTARWFPTRRGQTLSRDAIEYRIAHYARIAANDCPSLQDKKVTAHVLRHTTVIYPA